MKKVRKRRLARAVLALAVVLAVTFLFVREPEIPRATLEKKYSDSSSRFVMLPDGARAHVRDQGLREGSVLVLLHGSNASSLTWQPWVKRLTDMLRIITVDLPGHGLTGDVANGDYSQEAMVQFVAQLADALRLSRFSLGGNSMGGRISARFAEEFPDRLTHLILIDASGLPYKQPGSPSLALRIARVPILNRVLLYVAPRSVIVDGLNAAVSRKDIITDAMIDSYWDFVRMDGTRAATIKRLNTPDNGVEDRIGEIRAPTLILWGEEDAIVPVSVGREYHRLIPESKLILYPRTGHIPQEEVADESAAAVRAFLSTTP